MTSIGLLFAGSVLLINGVSLLGCCDATEAAPVNAFVGILLVAVVASICIPVSDLTPRTMFSAVGFLLFAFTYLGVAINSWTGGTGTALGWYCLWAVVASLVLAGVNFARYDDPRFGMLWLLWAVLFALFFLVLALGITRLESATGWAATIEAVITTTIPGGLMLLGYWRSVPGSVAISTGGITIVLIGALAIWSSGRSARRSASGEPTVAPTLAGAPLGFGGAALVGKLAPSVSATVAQNPGSAPPQDVTFNGAGTQHFIAPGSTHTIAVHLTAPITISAGALAVVLAIAGALIARTLGGWRAARMRPAEALTQVG